MLAGMQTITESTSSSPSNVSFSCWSVWKSSASFWVAFLGTLLSTVVVVANPTGKRDDVLAPAQLAAIILTLLAFPRKHALSEVNVIGSVLLAPFYRTMKTALQVAQEVHSWLWCTWLCWFGLYLFKMTVALLPTAFNISMDSPWLGHLENLLGNASSVTIFWAYWDLTRNTHNLATSKRMSLTPQFVTILLLVPLFLLDVFLRTEGAPQSYRDLLSGFLSVFALALFLGRLESQLIRAPLPLMLVNYCYVGLQTAYPLLPEGNKLFATLAYIAAMWLKLGLFMLVVWLLESGVLLYYLMEIRTVGNRVELGRPSYLAEFHEHDIKP